MYIEYAQGEGKLFQAYILNKLQKDSMYHMEDINITRKELLEILNAKSVAIMNFLTIHQQETGLESKNKQGGIFKSLNMNPPRMLGFLLKGPQGVVAEKIIAPAITEIIQDVSKTNTHYINELD